MMMHNDKIQLLIAEDDQNLAYLISENFKIAGYDAEVHATGTDVLRSHESKFFDLIILDLMLPDISGFELARKIKKRKRNEPFIFLTALKSENEKFKGYELGAEDYITKPFSFRELEYKIQAILRRQNRQMNSSKDLIVEDLVLNTVGREAKVNNKVFNLTQRESDLLALLMKNFGNYIKREEVLNLLWGRADLYTSNSMDVHIARLRKITGKSKNLMIKTLYGAGHRMISKRSTEQLVN